MIQSALLLVDIPFGNAITDAKASLALLHVIRDNMGFPNPDFKYTHSRHAALAHDLLANNRAAVCEIHWMLPFTILKSYFFMQCWLWEDKISCVILWTTVCWRMNLHIGTNWQQSFSLPILWTEVCQFLPNTAAHHGRLYYFITTIQLIFLQHVTHFDMLR